MDAIVIENVSYKYPGSREYAIKNINLVVREGEFLVLTGPSGGGKSTICRLMNGLIPQFYGGEFSGKVLVYGVDTRESSVKELARIVGLVFQNPENQIVNMTVEEEVAFGLENLGLPDDEIRDRLEYALRMMGIEELRRRATHELSSGELQKVALASVIAMKPRVLVLDEPTANMDPSSARAFLNRVYELWLNGFIKTIVLVEHRLSWILDKATRLVLVDKEVIADGLPRELVKRGVLAEHGVEEPQVSILARMLGLSETPLSVNEALEVFGSWGRRLLR